MDQVVNGEMENEDAGDNSSLMMSNVNYDNESMAKAYAGSHAGVKEDAKTMAGAESLGFRTGFDMHSRNELNSTP